MKIGLPVAKVARMQLEAGLPEVAMKTLVRNGWPRAKAKKFLQTSVKISGEDKATVASILLDKYVAENKDSVKNARPVEGVPAGTKVLRHKDFEAIAGLIKAKLGISQGEAEDYLRLAMNRKPMGLGAPHGTSRRAHMHGSDIYDHPQERLQVTTDEDLDGTDDTDDDSAMDEDGYATTTPSFDKEEMLDALEDPMPTEPQAELEPQEAYEAMKFMSPLSEEEEQILDTTPMLYDDPHGGGHPVRWVDDADHFEWITQRIKDRHNAMDEVLEDQMYGDDMDGDDMDGLTEEEMMDRAGSEVFDQSGWSLRKAVRKVGKGITKGVTRVTKGVARGVTRGTRGVARGVTRGTRGVARGVTRGTRGVARGTKGIARGAAKGIARGAKGAARGVAKGASQAWKTTKTFLPERDKKKAAIVKQLYAKLVKEHTNYLMAADRKRGVAAKPREAYLAQARQWSLNKIQRAGLPTSFTSGSETASNILGDDVMGSWWNPFSWFQKQTQYVLVNTQGERLAEMSSTEYEAFKGTQAAQALQQPGAPEGGPPEEGPPEGGPEAAYPEESAEAYPEESAEAYPEESAEAYPEEEMQEEGVEGDGLSGADEERAIEASGDADINRLFRRGGF